MAPPIYKIAPEQAWHEARIEGVFKGAGIDLADGYIHFSSAAQVTETLDKHYAGAQNLVLATIDPDALGDALVWEPSRGGALFPHLYGPLPMSAVVAERPLAAREDGGFDLPEIA